MELSLFLARVFGLYLLIVCVVFLAKRKALLQLVDELAGNMGLLVFSGAMTLFLGLMLVNLHNVWTADWRVLITILGWMTIAKGLLRLFAPEKVKPLAEKFAGPWLAVWMVTFLVIGAYLTYVGFTG